jgi:hypothetical protein
MPLRCLLLFFFYAGFTGVVSASLRRDRALTRLDWLGDVVLLQSKKEPLDLAVAFPSHFSRPVPQALDAGLASSWKRNIGATVFWVGEDASQNNPVHNRASSWDTEWVLSYGGTDSPLPQKRRGLLPVGFNPKQTPFYIALPYNDLTRKGHKPEASKLIPWFWRDFRGPGVSVCHGRWVALHKDGRICYAKWRDVGPFKTDDYGYVFGGERPKANRNGDAGIDISPAIRDFFGVGGLSVVDWKFVEERDVPPGPWWYGEQRAGTRKPTMRLAEN